MKKIFREPLFQFLLIALLLLGGERLINADDYADQQYQIVVDDQVLLQFMQLQAKTFKPEQAMAALKALSAEDRQRLVDDYARNEALFREAMALNLDKNDQVIRRRLIQKMDYLAQGFYDEVAPLTEADLQTYYKEHRQDYKNQPQPPLPTSLSLAKNAALKTLKIWQLNYTVSLLLNKWLLKMPLVMANDFCIIATMSIAMMMRLAVTLVIAFSSSYLLIRFSINGRGQCNLTMAGILCC